MPLFFKECKQILKSLIFYIFIVIFVLFITTQFGGDAENINLINKPEAGQEEYGYKITDNPEEIMDYAVNGIIYETYINSYSTYPFGFYKEIKLNENELQDMEELIYRLTGDKWEDIVSDYDNYIPQVKTEYSEFLEIMEDACEIIGKGSSYEKEEMENHTTVPMTYEDAMEEYESMINKDHVTGTYARLFCDYSVILLAVIPVFFGVTRCLRDRRAKAEGVIFSKSVSSAKIIISRYMANVVMIFLPVLITALIVQIPYIYSAEAAGISADYMAFIRYSVIWLLPEIMIVTALSFAVTELTGGIWAIFIQFVWAFASMLSSSTLVGDFGLKLVVRWNTLGGADSYLRQVNDLYINRAFYVGLSVVLVAVSILIYSVKRKKGAAEHGKIRKSGN